MSGSSNSIRILAVDDHPLFRQGIAALVATQPDICLVAEASNGREAIQQFRAHRPDIKIGRAHAELQSQSNIVCRLLLEKKKINYIRLGSLAKPVLQARR